MNTTIKIKTKTFQIVCEPKPDKERDYVGSAPEAMDILKPIFAGEDADQEHFVVLFLDTSRHVKGYKVLFHGKVDSCTIPVEMILRNALLFGSTAIMIAHNHPSGTLEPSPEDLKLTECIYAYGKFLNIDLVDAFLVSPTGECYSFLQHSIYFDGYELNLRYNKKCHHPDGGRFR